MTRRQLLDLLCCPLSIHEEFWVSKIECTECMPTTVSLLVHALCLLLALWLLMLLRYCGLFHCDSLIYELIRNLLF